MRNLYLGLQGLAPPDMKLLKVFLRFAGKTDRHQWALALHEPEDLVLRQTARQGETLPMGLDPLVQAPVAWILGEGEDASGFGGFTLQRPLQMEPFAALLRAREKQIEAAAERPNEAVPERAPERVVPLRAVAAPVARVAPTAVAPAPRQPEPAVAVARPERPASAVALAPAALADSTIVNEPQVAYRLLKWPGTDLMRGQPKFVRMLAFLTHKPLSVSRLMELSGVDETTCLSMLTLLDARGLLASIAADVDLPPARAERAPQREASPPAANVVALPERAAPRASAANAQSGLFPRLRKRLGLS